MKTNRSNPIKPIAFALVLLVASATALACNVPVFRYALERWRPDRCEVIVFFDKTLSESDQRRIEEFEGATKKSYASANVELIRSDVSQETNPQNKDLWLKIKELKDVELPYVVLRTTVSEKRAVNGWHGTLDKFRSQSLLDSPSRKELSRRLLNGDSVVWVVLKSRDNTRNQAVKELLSTELNRLAKLVEFPEGLGLPGSELYSEIPLLMKFTILEIDPEDPQEEFLAHLFRGFQPDSKDQPLVVPVFGRGRALEVIPADRIDRDLVGDLTRYLCGACSCQVKERNPGFDLLLSTPWEKELFGDNGELPPPPKEYDAETAPTLLTIPPGRSSRNKP